MPPTRSRSARKVERFPDRDGWLAVGFWRFELGFPGERLALCLLEAENMNAVRIENVVGGAESFLLAVPSFDEFGEPDVASRGLPVTKGEPAREMMPVWLIVLRQQCASGAGVEF